MPLLSAIAGGLASGLGGALLNRGRGGGQQSSTGPPLNLRLPGLVDVSYGPIGTAPGDYSQGIFTQLAPEMQQLISAAHGNLSSALSGTPSAALTAQAAQARAAARGNLFAQGRLGVASGGGITGRFNPELASIEEGIARANLAEQQTYTNLFSQLQSLPLEALRLSVAGRGQSSSPIQGNPWQQALGGILGGFGQAFGQPGVTGGAAGGFSDVTSSPFTRMGGDLVDPTFQTGPVNPFDWRLY